MNSVKLPFIARLALTLLCVVLIIYLMYIGKTLLIPLFFALLISVLLFPLTRLLEKWHLPRALAAMLSILTFVIAVGALIYFFTLQIANFSNDLPRLQTRMTEILHSLQHWITRKYHVNSQEQMDYLNKSASGMLNTAANSIGNTFLGIAELVIWVIFVIIYTFFMLYHRRLLTRFVMALFRPQYRSEVTEVVYATRTVINSYVMGLLIEMTVLIILNCSVLAILGIQYAILLGVLAAVLNIIPYLGIYTSIVISMFITFANGTGRQAIEVGIVFLIIHFLDSNILMPRIVGGRVKMNPFITIVAVIMGEQLWGIPGMFLFIPLTAIIKIISERVDGLKPWAILIGEETKEEEKVIRSKGREHTKNN
ncbi:MAG: AI-2E family transporter [Flavipsychrobacter sp.]